ncbi:hypothetical protein FPZ12_023455 [Amycolatopsis acidicola]|uniref:PepSY domain-containing protein n=1 Tax=Amycolatopsis acidicola TaxID=2596893 RepID=A0A5N0UXA6_9PSEU|nr:hypothetical protein [Amycolatopsis acidicola]KAA9158066.1 hypothetical protein FPZ12_023455 [Amycolatopsis acidicola]
MLSRTLTILSVGVVAVAVAACGTDDPRPAAPPASAAPVGQDAAGAVASGKYGGYVLGVEPDTTGGVPSWEVELADSAQGRIEVDVARRDARILEVERD